jgi:hypothetical protein
MAVAYYYDARYGRRSVAVSTSEEVEHLLAEVLAVRTALGHPTLTVEHGAGNALTLATDGTRALLVHFVGTDGQSFSSTGGSPSEPPFVFDYEGHWSEAAPEKAVPLALAIQALVAFAGTGTPAPSAVSFEQD